MIPKKIHYCWVGGNSKPPLVKKCIQSWKKYCPDYEIIEWNESNYDISKNIYMKQAYEAKKWAFVTDYMRLDIIYEHGGIYLDTDVELIKNIDDLLSNEAFAGIESINENENNVALGLGFGAEKGHPLIGNMRSCYDELQFLNCDNTYNMVAIPVYITNFLKQLGYENQNKLQKLQGITIYPSEYFCPKSWTTGVKRITRHTYSIHHYSASWYDEKKQKQYREELKQKKKDYYRHMPNRIIKGILGDSKYNKIKKLFGK